MAKKAKKETKKAVKKETPKPVKPTYAEEQAKHKD